VSYLSKRKSVGEGKYHEKLVKTAILNIPENSGGFFLLTDAEILKQPKGKITRINDFVMPEDFCYFS
jgi:hypothetical protein